jgi:hypothetical protein
VGALKQIAVFAVLVIAVAAWTTRDARKPEASAASASAVFSPRAEFARKVRDNAPLRTRLQEKYPDVYRDLAGQMRRDLSACVVSEVVPGILKATCQ